MSFSPPSPSPVVLPQAPATPPQFGAPTQGSKPQRKPMQPSFIGAAATANPSNTGQKTLLGT